MTKWYTNTCQETKMLLGRDFGCCSTCHLDPYERKMGAFEKYTKFKDLLFEACCGFPELTDDEWRKFEKKLIEHNESR